MWKKKKEVLDQKYGELHLAGDCIGYLLTVAVVLLLSLSIEETYHPIRALWPVWWNFSTTSPVVNWLPSWGLVFTGRILIQDSPPKYKTNDKESQRVFVLGESLCMQAKFKHARLIVVVDVQGFQFVIGGCNSCVIEEFIMHTERYSSVILVGGMFEKFLRISWIGIRSRINWDSGSDILCFHGRRCHLSL